MKKILIASLLTATLFLGVASVASANGHNCRQARCHVVHYGETLFSIGRHYDVDPYHIADANGLSDPDHIYAGQTLRIPQGSRYPWYAGSKCGYNDCNQRDYQRSNYQRNQNCGSNDCYQKPAHRPMPKHENSNCDSSDCKSGYYGYDFTGYFYGTIHPEKKQYSHTCGYDSNCW